MHLNVNKINNAYKTLCSVYHWHHFRQFVRTLIVALASINWRGSVALRVLGHIPLLLATSPWTSVRQRLSGAAFLNTYAVRCPSHFSGMQRQGLFLICISSKRLAVHWNIFKYIFHFHGGMFTLQGVSSFVMLSRFIFTASTAIHLTLFSDALSKNMYIK